MTTTLESTLTETLFTTPLHAWHQQAGAKLVPFGGWDMPLQYTRVFDEHAAVRNAAGLFDVSHMGIFTLTGPSFSEAAQWLDTLVPQSISDLPPAKAVYTQLLNEVGGILDDLIVYRVPESPLSSSFKGFEQLFIVCNASNAKTNEAWLRQHLPENVTLTSVSNSYGLVALQGPAFKKVLAHVGVSEDTLPERFCVGEATLQLPSGQGCPTLLCRTGYTGEDGVEILAPNDVLVALWQGLLTAGQPEGLMPAGLAARDTLRTEAAYPLHGHDIDATITPLEAGLGWSVPLNKPTAFIGQQALQQQKVAGVPRVCVCLKLDGKLIARQHDVVLAPDGSKIGEITSGTQSPTLGVPIAMALIQAEMAPALGESVSVMVRGKQQAATRVKRPFYSGFTK